MTIPVVRTESGQTDEAERARRVTQAVHNGRMEGVEVSEPTLSDAEEYAAGRITSAELQRRVRARHGIA